MHTLSKMSFPLACPLFFWRVGNLFFINHTVARRFPRSIGAGWASLPAYGGAEGDQGQHDRESHIPSLFKYYFHYFQLPHKREIVFYD